MTIKHPLKFLAPLLLLALLATLAAATGGVASAQDAAGDDFGIWYVQRTARARGGHLLVNINSEGTIEPCIRNGFGCEERDSFLSYFGNSEDMSMDRSYTIHVASHFDNPKIEVSTFYDSLYIEEHAAYIFEDVREFASRVGLDPICDHLDRDFPIKVCDNVQTIPIGRIFAHNEPGSRTLTFRPVAGDIGAYLITISSFDRTATGQYTVTLLRTR